MHQEISARIDEYGFVTRPAILRMGLDDRTIAAGFRNKELHRLGPGLYAGRDYKAMTAEAQHLLRCRAVASRFDESVAFSHQSAALLHGLPVWDLDLHDLHVTRLDDGRGRRQADVKHHVGVIESDEITRVAGLATTSLSRTLWDLANTATTEAALVTIDAALNRGLITEQVLETIAGRYASWRGARHAKVVPTLSDAAAESPGESRVRHILREGGIPRPLTQFKVFDHSGALVGITDFAWPEYRHLLEFDGMTKYGGSDDLAREKAREDRLRGMGWGVTRVVWSQLSTRLRSTLVADVRSAMESSRRQFPE